MRSSVGGVAAYLALGGWLVTGVVGIVVLIQWLRRHRAGRRFPTRLVLSHLVTAVVGIGLWAWFVASDRLLAGWLTFAALNVINGFGDAILTGRVRALTGVGPSWWKDYSRALRRVAAGRHPPLATLHAVLAGVTYFSTLVACVLATW